MSARGCPEPGCIWRRDESVRYCLDCGRALGCTCTVYTAGDSYYLAQAQPDCPRHGVRNDQEQWVRRLET